MAATSTGTLPPLSAATIILVVVASFLASIEAANPDVEALMALRNGLQDPNGELKSWDPDLVDACTWDRVVCDGLTKLVIRLHLIQLNLSGPLAPELGKMDRLQYLELQMNNFHGAIPEEFGDLKNLISLDLFNNNISGPIPASLGKLKSLVFLRGSQPFNWTNSK